MSTFAWASICGGAGGWGTFFLRDLFYIDLSKNFVVLSSAYKVRGNSRGLRGTPYCKF